MLSTMRSSWLLYALFALIALSSALNIEEALHIDGIEDYFHHGVKRQARTGESSTPEATSSPSPTEDPEPSSTPTSETPTSEPPTSREPSSTPPSSTPETSETPEPSSTPSSSSPRSTPAPTSARTTSSSSRSSTPTTPVIKSTPLVGTSLQETVIIFTTQSDGRDVIGSSTSTSTHISTTGTAYSTETPLPQSGNGNDNGGGLSDSNKKIIGGVVGGVGGAILLGGLAIVAWRVWGKKKRVSEDDDDLMAGTGSALGDKTSTSPNSTPFQSNLEQYHNPGGRPNAAANF